MPKLKPKPRLERVLKVLKDADGACMSINQIRAAANSDAKTVRGLLEAYMATPEGAKKVASTHNGHYEKYRYKVRDMEEYLFQGWGGAVRLGLGGYRGANT